MAKKPAKKPELETQPETLVAEPIETLKATFVGNGKNDPHETQIYNRTFPLNKPVDISDFSEFQIMKLTGNTHFEVSHGD